MNVDETRIVNLKPAIDQIRQRLHSGQAAAMVGAGFSLNATKKSKDAPKFPLWSDLTDQIFHQVYPDFPKDNDHLSHEQIASKARKTSDFLRLAQDFENNDRSKLDAFLEKAIPDRDYNPGELHKQLLNLPWADIFTTNQDTLLERTTGFIQRYYSEVLSEKALSSAAPPRIVKLHGTLGHNNYIFTERDFDNYPTHHEAFVSYVQTSRAINTFCLFGFSGDDPNFKKWNNWVLNVMANHAPQVYLIGLLNLSKQDKNYWRDRKVVPIDLSVLFQPGQKPDHALALEWFLNELRDEKGGSVVEKDGTEESEDDAPLLSWPNVPGAANTRLYMPEPYGKDLTHDQLKEIALHWRKQRLSYPGWLITPRANRENLWSLTEMWVDPVFQAAQDMDVSEAILVLHELCWRIRQSLFPFLIDHAKIIADRLETLNPFPDNPELSGSEVVRGNEAFAELDWKVLEEAWLELAFVVAQEAREDLDEQRFTVWMTRLESVIPKNGDWYHRWHHEQCLMALYKLNQNSLEQHLGEWIVPEADFVWSLRKSALYAELGQIKTATKSLEKSLTTIEEANEKEEDIHIGLLSAESWTLFALNGIKRAERIFPNDTEWQYKYSARREALKAYRCDPGDEIDFLSQKVSGLLPQEKPEETIKHEFDPGRVTTTKHFGHPSSIVDRRHAFALLTLPEHAGIPVRSGSVRFLKNAEQAAQWIWPSAPLWALSAYIRNGYDHNKRVDQWLTRVEVAGIAQGVADASFRMFVPALKQVIRLLPTEPPRRSSFSEEIVVALGEVLSRLTVLFSPQQLEELLDVTLAMYESPAFQKDFRLYSVVEKFLRRVLLALPNTELTQRLPEILSLTFPGDKHSLVDDMASGNWPEPVNYIQWDLLNEELIDKKGSEWVSVISKLTTDVEHGSSQVRSRVASRLEKLSSANLLTSDQKQAFGKALWSRTYETLDLPSETEFTPYGFMVLPAPEPRRAVESLRSYIKDNDFPRLFSYEEPKASPVSHLTREGKPDLYYSRNRKTENLINAWKYASKRPIDTLVRKDAYLIEWSPEEASELFDKILTWWRCEKDDVLEAKVKIAFKDEIQNRIHEVLYIVGHTILPHFKASEESEKSKVFDFLEDLENSDFVVLSPLPMTLYLNSSKERQRQLTDKLRRGIHSQAKEEVSEALQSTMDWLAYAALGELPEAPQTVLEDVALKLVARRGPKLRSTIQILTWIIRFVPQVLGEVSLRYILIALQFLLEETTTAHEIKSAHTPISAEEIPHLRVEAAKLASELYRYYGECGREMPEILQEWQQISFEDPLPEVRKAFSTTQN